MSSAPGHPRSTNFPQKNIPRNADFGFGLGAEKGILGLVGAGEYPDIDRAWTAAVGVEILTLFLFSISTEAENVGIYMDLMGISLWDFWCPNFRDFSDLDGNGWELMGIDGRLDGMLDGMLDGT